MIKTTGVAPVAEFQIMSMTNYSPSPSDFTVGCFRGLSSNGPKTYDKVLGSNQKADTRGKSVIGEILKTHGSYGSSDLSC